MGIEPFIRFLYGQVADDDTSTSVKTFLDMVRDVFAEARLIKSDGGPSFTSAETQAYCKEKNKSRFLSRPYCPQTDGSIELSHASVKAVFCRECEEKFRSLCRRISKPLLYFILFLLQGAYFH